MGPDTTEKLRILIVDDEPGALEALGDIFEDRDYEVTKAASGQEARAAIRRQEFDVALLDIRLPDARGTDLLREIRQNSDNTRCIMVTASAEAEDAINALNEGASAYIAKPIDVDLVMHKIRDVVAKYRKTVEDRRRLRELDVVKDVGEAAMDLDLERMLNNVLTVVVRGFEADAGAMMLLDEDGRTLRGAVQMNLSERPLSEFVVRLGEGFVGRVASQKRVLSVEDLSGISYSVTPYLQSAHVSSVLGAPILGPRGVLGTLLIAWRSSRAFTRADEHLLGVLAQRTGLATENARLYAREDASKRRAEYLALVSQELNSRIEDERQVVERVTRLATERLGDGCAIFIKRPGTDRLDAVLSYHKDPRKQSFIEQHLRDNPVRLGEGNIGRVAVTGESILSGPEAAVSAYPDRAYLAQVGIRSALAVPLRAQGEIFGVMSCSVTESDGQYTMEDLALAAEFADRASVAIENARLLRESQEKRQELQALFEITRVVTSSLQEAEVIASLLQGTADLTAAPACCIATVHPERQSIEVDAQTGLSHEAASELVNHCFTAWHERMLDADRPFIVEDLQAVPEEVVAECAQRLGIHSMASVPFDVDGRRNGILIVLNVRVDAQAQQRQQMLAALGGLAGVAINNARSYKRERTIAERLQQWILSPEANVDVGDLQIARDYHAALNEASVGGDFFDIFSIGPDQFGVVIGDVSGKGLEAALHTQAVKHTLRAYALSVSTHPDRSNSPSDVLTQTNDAVCFMLPSDIFITLFYGVVSTRDRTLRYANAGHDAPILYHADGTTETLESTGRALGLLAGASYDEEVRHLEPGEVMLLYTDGVTEARRNGAFLEIGGVIDLVKKHSHESAESIVKGIYRDVKEYTESNLHDDIALLALRVPPKKG